MAPARNAMDWGSRYESIRPRNHGIGRKPLLRCGLGRLGVAEPDSSLQITAAAHGIDLGTSFEKFPEKIQNLLLYGEAVRMVKWKPGKTGFRGFLGYLKQAVEDSTSDTYREFLLTICRRRHVRFARASGCVQRAGGKVNGMSIADLRALPVSRALQTARKIKLNGREPLSRANRTRNCRAPAVSECGRAGYIRLSVRRHAFRRRGQRIRLATQIGSKLRGVPTSDEPSIGLHHRDNGRLLLR